MRWLRAIRNKWRALIGSEPGALSTIGLPGRLGIGFVLLGWVLGYTVPLGSSWEGIWLNATAGTLLLGLGLIFTPGFARQVKQSRALEEVGPASLDFGPVQVLLSSRPIDGQLVSEFTVNGLWQGLHIESGEWQGLHIESGDLWDGRRFPSGDTGPSQPPVARHTITQCGLLSAENVALLDTETVKQLQELAALATLRIQDGTLQMTFDTHLNHVSNARSLAEKISQVVQRIAAPPEDVVGRLLELTEAPSPALPVEREIANTAGRQLVRHYPEDARVLEWAKPLARTPADIDASLAVELWCLLRRSQAIAIEHPLLADHIAHADVEAIEELITLLSAESGPKVEALLSAVLEHASSDLSLGQRQSIRDRLAMGGGRLSLSESRGGALSEAQDGALSPAEGAGFERTTTD